MISQSWANLQIQQQNSQNNQSQQLNVSSHSAQKKSEQLYSLPSFGLLANEAPAGSKNSPVKRLASPPPVKHTFGVQEQFSNQNQNNIFFNRNLAENSNQANNFTLNEPLADSYQRVDQQVLEEVKQPIFVKKTPASQQIDHYFVDQRQLNISMNYDNSNQQSKDHFPPQVQVNSHYNRGANFTAEEKKSQQNISQSSSVKQNNSEKKDDFQYAHFIESPPALQGQVDQRSQQAQPQISPTFRFSQQSLNQIPGNLANPNVPINQNKPQQFSYAMPLLGFQQQQPQIIQGTQFVYGNGRLLEGFMQMPPELFNQHQQYVVVANINNQNNIHVFEQPSQVPINNQQNEQQSIQSLLAQPLIPHQSQVSSNNNVQQNIHNLREQLIQSVNSVQSISQRGQNSANGQNSSLERYINVGGIQNIQLQQEINQAFNSNNNLSNFVPQQIASQQQQQRDNSQRYQQDIQNNLINRLQDPFQQELNLPVLGVIEENKSDEDSQLSSIPSEHQEGMNSNEYIRRYALNIVTITWNRDSHGLFDFEVRQLARQTFQTAQEQNFIRMGEGCRLIDTKVDLRSEFHKKAQLLMHIKPWRNFFLLETPVKYMLSHAQNETEINQIQTRDVEMFYSDQGEQLLQPYDMCERMYLVVRSIINDGNVQQDYELKKGDIIKVGRAKFLVRDVNIVKKNEELVMRKEKIKRRRKEFVKLIAKKRALSQEKVQHPSNLSAQVYLEMNQKKLERRALHRGGSPTQHQRSNSEVIIDTFQNNLQNQQIRGLSQVNCQTNQSSASATHITDQVVQQIQRELSEEGILFPEYLDEVKSENSSDESYKYKRKRPSFFVPEEESKSEKNFKKIMKKYVNLEMAPLAGLEAQPGPLDIPLQQNPPQNLNGQNSSPHKESQKKQDSKIKNNMADQQEAERDSIPLVQSFQPSSAPEQMGLDSSSPYCRFCWVNEHDMKNPLISSCKCSGGVQFVHYECLKMWIKTKMIQQNTARISMLYWKTFECEICKSTFPFRFKTQNGIKYNLFDLNVSKDKNYLVLEGINIEKTSSKMIYVLRPELSFQIFKMGRANDQDIRINDISVSRQHATIVFDNSKFLIKDNLSKFGTLIQIQKYLDLKPNQTRIMQVGRTIMNVSLRSIKRQPAKGNAIMWKDESKGNPILNPLLSQANAIRNLMDNQKNVRELVDRIKNAESYIKQQSNVHRRLIANGNLESQTYNIERRQMNANLDDFYKNQAIDDSVSSQDPADNEEEAKHLDYEESKGVSPPRNQQIFHQNSNNLSQNVGRYISAPNNERRIPLGRIFIDNEEDLLRQQQQQQRHQDPYRYINNQQKPSQK